MDTLKPSLLRWTVPALLLFAVSCQDALTPTAVPEAAEAPGSLTSQEMRGQSPEVVSEIMALPATVFGQFDQASGQFVFGVEHMGVARGIQTAMERRGIPASSYQVRVTEPIHFASTTLRSVHRPTRGGIQIHFSNYLCTLGFNVDHGGVASFITNSHCTDQQGTTSGTIYYQPTSSADPNSIGTEVHDPEYFKGGACSRGKKCRYSDAARAAYASGIDAVAEIAETDKGVNSGDLNTSSSFTVGSQDNSSTKFSGLVNKVGRTTGWTDGDVTKTCATVNVSGTNIQLLCQTLVENPGRTIVGAGDSGSPVFQGTGPSVTLVGILWGGSSNGELFVFSPLKNIQDELGAMTANFSGTLTGGGAGDGGGGDGGGDDGGSDCPPNSNAPQCRG